MSDTTRVMFLIMEAMAALMLSLPLWIFIAQIVEARKKRREREE